MPRFSLEEPAALGYQLSVCAVRWLILLVTFLGAAVSSSGSSCVGNLEFGRRAQLSVVSDSVQQKFIWGSDQSGSEQGAGGVGGLLWLVDVSAAQTHLVCADGNGNTTALVEAAIHYSARCLWA